MEQKMYSLNVSYRTTLEFNNIFDEFKINTSVYNC